MEVDVELPLSRLSSDPTRGIIVLSEDEDPTQTPATSVSSIVRKFTAPAVVKQVQRQEVVQSKPKGITPL